MASSTHFEIPASPLAAWFFETLDALVSVSTDTQGGLLIAADAQNTLLLSNVSLATLEAHPEDLLFA